MTGTKTTTLADSVRVYYFYSFLFDKMPLSESLGKKPLDLVGQKIAAEMTAKGFYSRFEFHLAEEKEPNGFRSDVYLMFPHFSITSNTEDSQLILNGGNGPKTIECSVKKHTALFESGMGVVGIVLSPKGPLSTGELVHLSNLSDCDNCCSLKIGDQDVTPFTLFKDTVERLRQDLVAFFSNPQLDDSVKDHRISWIEYDEAFIHDEPEKHHSKFQEAHVVSVLGLSDKHFDNFYSSGQSKSLIDRELRQVAMRQHDSEIAPDFAAQHFGNALSNMIPDKRFIVCMFARSIVIGYKQSAKYTTNNLEELLLKGLFRTLVALRGTWHFYLITNERIDQKIKSLFSQFEKLLKKEDISQVDLAEKQQEIAITKGEFMRNLGVEDPLVRSVGLSPFAKVYDEGTRIYRTFELRELVWRKLDELTSLFNMVDEYSLRLKYERPRRAVRSGIWSRWRWWSISIIILSALSPAVMYLSHAPLEFYYILLAVLAILFVVLLFRRTPTDESSESKV